MMETGEQVTVQTRTNGLEDLQSCLRKLEEALTCSICLDTFRDPRILKCRHTFCLSCLHNLYRTSYSKFIKCPNCKQETPVEANGVEGLEKNKELDSISKVHEKMKNIVESQGNGTSIL